MISDTKISIAVTGHTNTGKTTLIRTLMKSNIGEVGDYANVTKVGRSYYYDGLQANFVDTPGFRYASVYSMYLDILDQDSEFQMPTIWRSKIRLDLDSIKAIKESTIAIYVGSLYVVPDESYIEEINVVRRLQPKVIGILNQYQKQLKTGSQKDIEFRINLWKEAFSSEQISQVIVFDAHWDRYSKTNQIYDSVYGMLNRKEKDRFLHGLTLFKERQQEILNEASSILADCVLQLQKLEIISLRGDYSEDIAKNKIAQKILEITIDFTEKVNNIYKVAAEYPTETNQDLQMRFRESANVMARLGWGAGFAAVFGGGGAAIGSGIGAVIGGILSGGLGAGPGATIGYQIGTTIGAGIGSLFVFIDDNNDKLTLSINSKGIESLVIECLAIIWGLSINGYGRDRKLTNHEIEEIQADIHEAINSSISHDWKTLDKNKITSTCKSILDEIEKKDNLISLIN